METTKKLFAFVEEEVVDEVLPFIGVWKPAPILEQVRCKDSQSIIKELPPEDENFLNENKEYQQVIEKYGYK